MPFLPKPDYCLPSVLEITPEWLHTREISAVFLDVDNTLGGYNEKKPCPEVAGWLQSLRERGVIVALVSNAREKRVERYSGGDIPYIARSGKPKPDALLEMARRLGLEPGRVAMVGDQLLTDVKAGRRAGLRTVWVEPSRNNWALDIAFRLRRVAEAWVAGIRRETR